MANVYDNWERLVAAVLKREEIWELCHAPSRSSSFSSFISSNSYPSSHYPFDEDLKSAESMVQEWIEKYEFAVAHIDGSKEVKGTQFSWKNIFNGKVAGSWLNRIHKYPNGLGRNELLSLPETTFDKNMRSRNSEVKGTASNEIVSEWVDNYEPGVYVALRSLEDETAYVLVVGFSLKRFKMHQAKAWWHQNEKNVYKKYSAENKLARIRQPSEVREIDNLTVVEWIEEYDTGETTQVRLLRPEVGWSFVEYNGIPLFTLVKDTILEINFNGVLKSANLDGPIGHSRRHKEIEVIERYQPGVYLSLESSEDWISDVERVRFSRNMFKPHEALIWWIKNREKVFRRYRTP